MIKKLSFENNLTFLLCILISLIVGFIIGNNYNNRLTNTVLVSKVSDTYVEPGIPAEKSVEEMYQDIFMTLLSPYIHEAVKDYYGKAYAVAPYSTNVLSVERLHGYRSFGFLIKLEILPYTGPHNTVGLDHITLSIKQGDVTLECFEHIKSYDVPEYNTSLN